jgi:hypothetical protein
MKRGPQDCAPWPETALSPRPSVIAAALASVLGVAASAAADTWTVVPTMSLSAIYDDNLFFTDARLGAAGLMAGSAVSVEYRPSTRFSMLGRAGLDSEYFGEPQVSNWAARRNAGLTARYRLGAFTSVSLSGNYALSAYAGELVPTAGVDFGRRAAESLGGQVEIEHRVNSKIVLRAGYAVQTLQLEGSSAGPRSQLSSDSDITLQLTPHTTLRLQLGPRYLAGSLSAHVAANLERVRPRTQLSFGYERGRSLVFDRTLVIESYAAKLSYRLSRAVTLSASPALFRQWELSTEQRSWHMGGNASYRASRWLTIYANHAYVLQDRGFFIDPRANRPGSPQLSRNTLTAGVTITPRPRREESPR